MSIVSALKSNGPLRTGTPFRTRKFGLYTKFLFPAKKKNSGFELSYFFFSFLSAGAFYDVRTNDTHLTNERYKRNTYLWVQNLCKPIAQLHRTTSTDRRINRQTSSYPTTATTHTLALGYKQTAPPAPPSASLSK